MIPLSNPFHQAETPGEGSAETSPGDSTLLLLVTLVMTGTGGSFFITSTRAAGETSNLNNRYLGIQNDIFPGKVYRGDARSPKDIFTPGFTAQGTNYDLVQHIIGTAPLDSGYISTTGTLRTAETFAEVNGKTNLQNIAQSQGCSTTQEFFYTLIPLIGQFLLGECTQRSNAHIVIAKTYVYEIDPAYAQNAFYVPTAIKANTAFYEYNIQEDEWAYAYRFLLRLSLVSTSMRWPQICIRMTQFILEQQVLRISINLCRTRIMGAQRDKILTTILGTIPGSGWTYDTDIDLPTPTCPANPTVIQHCG